MEDLAALDRPQLASELDAVELAIGRSAPFERYADMAGAIHVRVSAELLALAEREHLIADELRRRGRQASGGAATATVTAGR